MLVQLEPSSLTTLLGWSMARVRTVPEVANTPESGKPVAPKIPESESGTPSHPPSSGFVEDRLGLTEIDWV